MPSPTVLRPALVFFCAAAVLGTPITSRATSYPLGGYPQISIELLVSDSSLIVRACVADAVSYSPLVQLQVLETIRGTPPPNRIMLIDNFSLRAKAELGSLQGAAKPELLVLVGAHVARAGPGNIVYDEAVLLNQPSEYGYVTLNFEIIKDPAQILTAVRDSATRLSMAPKNTNRAYASELRAFNGNMTVTAPVNQLLLDHVQKWADSLNADLRLSALEALTKSNAPDTEPFMRRFLTDPYASFSGYEISRTARFPIRHAAAQWLDGAK